MLCEGAISLRSLTSKVCHELVTHTILVGDWAASRPVRRWWAVTWDYRLSAFSIPPRLPRTTVTVVYLQGPKVRTNHGPSADVQYTATYIILGKRQLA